MNCRCDDPDPDICLTSEDEEGESYICDCNCHNGYWIEDTNGILIVNPNFVWGESCSQ